MEQTFSISILSWYTKNKRDLPWRHTNIDPYHVLVSEIMLQQTQVPRVIIKFQEFIRRFPTLPHLAQASKAEVIQAWSGMGYNRRALLLHQFAQEVMSKHEGKIPETATKLISLPGIGSYTAGSIASFAYNKPEPAIDVNVRRIYMRYFRGKDQGLPMGREEEKKLYELVKSTIPKGKSRDLHNALMDFGSLLCTRDTPQCFQCPLNKSCHFAPLYSTKKEKALFVMEKKIEKGVYENGRCIPNRIFRGRIVEFVRKNEGKEIGFEEFGKVIKKDYVQREEQWLRSLCLGLQKDNLIEFMVNDGKIVLSLAQ